MILPRIAINNYRFTILAFVLLTIAGINSYLFMPRTENPEMTIPGASVYAVYPGANPSDLEKLIAIPLEESINELDDIKEISTHVRDGVVICSVEFYFDSDADKKYDEVVRQINGLKNELPDEVVSITAYRWSSSDVTMLQLGLVSPNASFASLENEADKLKKSLEKISGIRKVEFKAIPEQEVQVNLDFEKMAQMNISLDHVINAIKSTNANIPGGNIEIGDKSFRVKTSGSYNSLVELENTIINSYQGRLILLRNIAEVSYGYEENNYFARYNGKRAIWVTIQQKEGLNIFKIFDEIEKKLIVFEESLKEDVKLEIVFNQKKEVNKNVNGFQKNLLQGIVLVGLVVLLALGFKSAIIVIIAIPLSIIMGLFAVDVAAYGLQQISIAGLVVALGLLVDNSIVMIENINRFIAKGYAAKEAAIEAASEIGWPIISATITTVLAFIPIIMMPDKAGFFIRSMPVTITATLVFSLLIALTLTPLIASKLFKSKKGKPTTIRDQKGASKYLSKFVEGPYRRLLKLAFKRRILFIVSAFVILSITLFGAAKYLDVSFFPKAEKAQFMIRAELPEDVNLGKTDVVARYIESKLEKIEEVKLYATNVGNGNPRIYYNVWTRSYVKNFAEIFVELKQYDAEEFDRIVGQLRDELSHYPGAKISIKEFEQGVPISAPIEILITGKDFDLLQTIAGDVDSKLAEQSGAVNITNELAKERTDIYFNINKEKANMLGVPIYEIDKTIRTAIHGLSVSKYRDKEGDEIDIMLKMDVKDKVTLEDIDKVYVKSMSGRMIPLKQLATIEFMKVSNSISRINLERTASIHADVKKDHIIDDIMKPVIDYLESYNFPDGYAYKIGGELESRNETFGGMAVALIIAIIAIFAVLVLQFKSFTQPLIIFIALPFALIGMIWALLATGNSFSFTAFVGLISLVGIVINNSIILVDYTNRLRAKGESMFDALQIAGETRFTPIILTSLTTIGGIFPLTLGGGTLWAPLGWTIIGGLLVSTLLTLVMIPVFYSYLAKKN